jgi:tetratricopeptide (TPR) repeat protein
MSLPRIILSLPDQSTLSTKLSVQNAHRNLWDYLRSSPDNSTKQISGNLDGDNFRLSKTAGINPFTFTSKLALKEQAGKTLLLLDIDLSPVTNVIVTVWLHFLLGSFLAVTATAFLTPAPFALITSILGSFAIPALLLAGILISLKVRLPEEKQAITNILASVLNAVPEDLIVNPKKRPSLILATVPLFAFVGGCLGLAFFLHSEAWNLWVDGKYKQCEELCRPVLTLTEFALGPHNSIVAQNAYYIAECCRMEGNLDEASHFYKVSLEGCERNLGANHKIVADNCYNLARVEEQKGNLKEAQKLYKRAMQIWDNSPEFGPRSAVISKLCNRLALLDTRLKDYKEAIAMQERANIIDKNYAGQYPEAKDSVAIGTNDMGVIQALAGHTKEAESLYKEALTQKKRLFGGANYSDAITMYNLSELYQGLDQKTEAEALRSKAIKIWHDYLPNHPDVGKLLSQDKTKLFTQIRELNAADYEVPHWEARVDAIVDEYRK